MRKPCPYTLEEINVMDEKYIVKRMLEAQFFVVIFKYVINVICIQICRYAYISVEESSLQSKRSTVKA